MSRLRVRLTRFLRVKPITNLVFSIRFFYWVKIRKQVRFFENEGAVLGHDYSIDKVYKGRPTDRILKLLQPLSVIDVLNEDSKILSIGCRFEGDMLYLAGFGFKTENLRGLDMISYSPWIDLGNMHDMPYSDSSWDATVQGWVLAYSDNPKLAADELVRVTRVGGLIAIGLTYYPEDILDGYKARGELTGPEDGRIQTTEGVLALFEGSVDRLYFRHDPHDANKQGPCMVIFSVKK